MFPDGWGGPDTEDTEGDRLWALTGLDLPVAWSWATDSRIVSSDLRVVCLSLVL